MPTLNEVLAAAVKHHQEGRRAQAASLYKDILGVNPKQPDALHLLGVIANESGDQQKAARLIRQAIAIRPGIAEFHNNLGNALQAQAKFLDAIACYEKAIDLKGNYATAHNNLGNASKAVGRKRDALVCYRKSLQLQPNYPGGLCNLASVLLDLGDPNAAVDALQKALRLNPNFPEAYNNLGNALQTLTKLEESEKAYRKALELRPNYPAVLNNLGSVLQASDRMDEAVQCFRSALESQPNYADAHVNLGTVLLHLGRTDEAIASLSSALDLNHRLARPYHELALLASKGKYSFPNTHLQRLREFASGPELISKDNASLLNFALARLAESEADYQSAFEHYEKGNCLRQEHLREQNVQVDHEKYLKIIDTQISFFDSEFFANVKRGTDSELPVFIVGMPRSGTTLVEQILATHPNIFGAGELKHIATIAGGLQKRLASQERYPSCLAKITGESLVAVAEEYLSVLKGRGGEAERVVDKMPLNYNHLGLLATLFPNAKFVHCQRDPIDTCFSGFTQYAIPTSLKEIAACYRQYQRLMQHWYSVLPVAIHTVQYEDLVANQEAETRKLLDYCGVEWNDQCLSFHQTARNVQTPSKLDVRRPIYKTAIGSWKKYEDFLQPLIDGLQLDDAAAASS